MTIKSKKEITNNDLYDFLVTKFDNIDNSFKDVDSRFNDVDKRFNNIESRFGNVDIRFDGIEGRLEKLEITQDYMLGELKELKEEKIVGTYRSQRMESWIMLAAKKLDLPYNP